ncbi:sigma-70 family RNA polymerase sigma factor [Cohnella sp. CFH 77786]|uniref:sigma-70 family RNA polymerase sigma factor n=1 Tax=Cohnella sp. CFH 77786 TaxID=2662265 RepID=UPI001C60AB03|nr:sigma-70 family RNA polymerase sigma factor [Cohnella sp. CFH 77786]MBW5447765.1 sigma-70 family RNA polymerase sigma factor [Cohnella sp. CFH 77786]
MADLVWTTDVQLAVGGDREAFARLIGDLQGEMYGMARSMLQRDEDVADAIQDTILKAYLNVTRLREPAFFRTWLFRILIRECQAVYRKKKRIVLSDRVPEAAAFASGPDLDLRAAVNRLGEPARTIVKLHYYADLPLAEIAELLDLSEGTLKSKLHRARRKLAHALSSPGEGGVGYELH